jgi:hypothetical protein
MAKLDKAQLREKYELAYGAAVNDERLSFEDWLIQELEQATQEARRIGRAEAQMLLLQEEAEAFALTYMHSTRLGDSGDFQMVWNVEALTALLGTDQAAFSLFDELDRRYGQQADELEALTAEVARLQQPEELQRNAACYLWLRNEAWAGYHVSKGHPEIVAYVPVSRDGAGNVKCILAEDALDAAVDRALAGQKARSARSHWQEITPEVLPPEGIPFFLWRPDQPTPFSFGKRVARCRYEDYGFHGMTHFALCPEWLIAGPRIASVE